MKKTLLALVLSSFSLGTYASNDLNSLFKQTEPKVIEWRRDFHQKPRTW